MLPNSRGEKVAQCSRQLGSGGGFKSRNSKPREARGQKGSHATKRGPVETLGLRFVLVRRRGSGASREQPNSNPSQHYRHPDPFKRHTDGSEHHEQRSVDCCVHVVSPTIKM